MNIRCLERRIAEIDETAVIGKSAVIGGSLLEILGLVRIGVQVRVIALLYDEAWRERQEAREADEAADSACRRPTLRERMRAALLDEMPNPIGSAAAVRIGDGTYAVCSVATSRVDPSDWEMLILVSRFLQAGWKPAGIGEPDMDSLLFTALELEGRFDRLPSIPPDPAVRFSMHRSGMPHRVELPLSLPVREGAFDRIRFEDAGTGEPHWMRIHRVYLLDMRQQMAAALSAREVADRMTPEQIADLRARLEEALDAVCPHDMRYPVIEYECEEGLSMQFYTRASLDAEPPRAQGAYSTGIITGTAGGIGPLGTRLKAAVVQEPVPAGTDRIDVELFAYFRETDAGDITLD